MRFWWCLFSCKAKLLTILSGNSLPLFASNLLEPSPLQDCIVLIVPTALSVPLKIGNSDVLLQQLQRNATLDAVHRNQVLLHAGCAGMPNVLSIPPRQAPPAQHALAQ